MDTLWSPWRYQYVAKDKRNDECIFCAIAASSDDEANLVLHRAKYNFLVLNHYPYAAGHLMVVPYEHVASLSAAKEETCGETMLLMRRAETLLRRVYHPEGLNMGLNLGSSAGAGIANHLHVHVLPRWSGDANFMTTVSETRVIPEGLGTTYAKLRVECEQW